MDRINLRSKSCSVSSLTSRFALPGFSSAPPISRPPVECCSGMFGGHAHGDAILGTREMLQIGIVTFFMIARALVAADISIEQAVERLPRWVVTTVWAVMACAIILNQGSSNAFIYFQF